MFDFLICPNSRSPRCKGHSSSDELVARWGCRLLRFHAAIGCRLVDEPSPQNQDRLWFRRLQSGRGWDELASGRVQFCSAVIRQCDTQRILHRLCQQYGALWRDDWSPHRLQFSGQLNLLIYQYIKWFSIWVPASDIGLYKHHNDWFIAMCIICNKCV